MNKNYNSLKQSWCYMYADNALFLQKTSDSKWKEVLNHVPTETQQFAVEISGVINM